MTNSHFFAVTPQYHIFAHLSIPISPHFAVKIIDTSSTMCLLSPHILRTIMYYFILYLPPRCRPSPSLRLRLDHSQRLIYPRGRHAALAALWPLAHSLPCFHLIAWIIVVFLLLYLLIALSLIALVLWLYISFELVLMRHFLPCYHHVLLFHFVYDVQLHYID